MSWLVSENYRPTPLASVFRIESVEKFSLKRLQKILREEDIGILEIKKRNFAVEPEVIRKQIKLDKKKPPGKYGICHQSQTRAYDVFGTTGYLNLRYSLSVFVLQI